MVKLVFIGQKMNKEEIKNLLYALHHSTYRNEQQIKNNKDCGCYVKDVGLLLPLYYHKRI